LVGALLIVAAVASALLAAAAVRFPSLVAALLTAYLALVANLALTTLVLSPLHAVTRIGLAAAEAMLLLAALAAWWLRGRPGLPLAGPRAAAAVLLRDPVLIVFAGFVLVLLGYELVLALTVPPNNGDALGYHLPKAAAWAQQHAIHWIANAPTVRMNAFQPLAEQQILFLLVATGGGALIALPQYLAQLAILVAVYGAARRLGFDVRRSTGAALLLATFSLLALEATTAQNDLVVASFPVVAACLLLGGGTVEAALAGAAGGMAVGAKLTAVLVAPVLLWLAVLRGRRVVAAGIVGAAAGFAAIGIWGYALNVVHTGHVLGVGTAFVEDRSSPTYPGSLQNGFTLLYGMMDVSVLWKGLIEALAVAAVVAGAAAWAWARRHRRGREALGDAAGAALPFAAPLLVLGGAAVIAFITDRWGYPIRGAHGILQPVEENLNLVYTHISNEDFSAFGPVGIVALVLAISLAIRAVVRRSADYRHLALAVTLPFFLVVMSLSTFWNPFLIRFFLVPAVLTAPLLAFLFRSTAVLAAWAAAAAIAITLTVVRDQTKPLSSPYGLGRPWELTQSEALSTNSRNEYADAVVAYHRLVPGQACVGAVLGMSDPSYLLYGPKLRHRVYYLSANGNTVQSALQHGLFYVVINPEEERNVPREFEQAGWRLEPLGALWVLATDAQGSDEGSC
jgi:hypothetical protein